ncbi:uncharacterized protein F5Z01DRAFT_278168 [Emericellopsis atlantica]|uniref:Zn(2)-C6 fungal-type domain-containing protein n=1 Tax=Emericellopsis atlantica TaxID=2614577 RepID=A0A9P7ZH46_9HYPO|nr:uncharacterized protein F5Z01DRAFT_278168 [Emericellopsis atlantica]KAG9251373.1 hypothetical protein F5Z01DRAFT_278168 [Emericellopsis atlantica]
MEKRRQNHSCEQCRRSKKACDGFLINKKQNGAPVFSNQDSAGASKSTLPCSYCARTNKTCSLNPYWAQQRRASKSLCVDEEATENYWNRLETQEPFPPHVQEQKPGNLSISLPPSLDPWNGEPSSWLSLGLLDFLALASHTSPATYSSSSPESSNSSDVFFDDPSAFNYAGDGYLMGQEIIWDSSNEPSPMFTGMDMPGAVASHQETQYQSGPKRKRRKTDCSDYSAAHFAMEPADRELISDSVFRIFYDEQE